MKRSVLLSVLFGAMPLLSMAQDDLYFTPSKADQSAYQQSKVEEDRPVYYSGIGKSNDEYNRRGKYNYKKIGVDSLGNDIFMSAYLYVAWRLCSVRYYLWRFHSSVRK